MLLFLQILNMNQSIGHWMKGSHKCLNTPHNGGPTDHLLLFAAYLATPHDQSHLGKVHAMHLWSNHSVSDQSGFIRIYWQFWALFSCDNQLFI